MGHKSKATKKNKAKKQNRAEIKRTLQGKRQKGYNLPTRGSGGVKVNIKYRKKLIEERGKEFEISS